MGSAYKLFGAKYLRQNLKRVSDVYSINILKNWYFIRKCKIR
jgi:hypothetical protein